jgi:hypothetical protein
LDAKDIVTDCVITKLRVGFYSASVREERHLAVKVFLTDGTHLDTVYSSNKTTQNGSNANWATWEFNADKFRIPADCSYIRIYSVEDYGKEPTESTNGTSNAKEFRVRPIKNSAGYGISTGETCCVKMDGGTEKWIIDLEADYYRVQPLDTYVTKNEIIEGALKDYQSWTNV